MTKDWVPTSDAESALLAWEGAHPNTSVYNLGFVLEFDGPIDSSRLVQSVIDVIAVTDSLWTSYQRQQGRYLGRVTHHRPPPAVPHTLATTAEETEVALRDVNRAAIVLNALPLARAVLVDRPALRGPALHLLFHHIAIDGVSIKAFIEAVRERYRTGHAGLSSRPARPDVGSSEGELPYGAIDDDPEEGAIFSSSPDSLTLPLRPVSSIPKFTAAEFRLDVDLDLHRRLARACGKIGATPAAAYLAAFAGAVGSVAGQVVVPVALAVSTRTSADAAVALKVRSVPTIVNLSGVSLLDLLADSGDALLRVVENPGRSLQVLNRRLRKPELPRARLPITQCAFNMHYLSAATVYDFNGTSAKFTAISRQALNFDLMLECEVSPNDGVGVKLTYRRDLYRAQTPEAVLHNFQRLLTLMAAGPSKSPWRQVLVPSPGPDTGLDTKQPVNLEAILSHDRTQDALRLDGSRLTYSELAAEVLRTQERLAASGVREGSTVALDLNHPWLMTITVLAALALKANYVPIDPRLPRARRARMLHEAACALYVNDRADLPNEACTSLVLAAGTLTFDGLNSGTENAVGAGSDRDELAAIIFTSGTTGTPKGSRIRRSSMERLIGWFNGVTQTDPGSSVLQLFSHGFDPWGLVVLGALARGDTVVSVDSEDRLNPERLAAAIATNKIQSIICVPTTFGLLARVLLASQHEVREIFVGGDVLDHPAEATLRGRGVAVHRLYGPTENTVVSTWCPDEHARSVEDHPAACIGFPLPGVRVTVSDDAGRPAPVGSAGELILEGDLVADGYILTGVTDPFFRRSDGQIAYRTNDWALRHPDGSLEYVRRGGRFVKVAGNRFDVRELEQALAEITDCEVVGWTTGEDLSDQHIACAVAGAGALSDSEILEELRQRLPDHGLPEVIVRVRQMPVDLNGKTDLADLRRLAINQLRLVAPSLRARPIQKGIDPFTRSVSTLWARVLGTNHVGSDQDLFAAGADSFSVLQGLQQMKANFGATVGFAEFAELRTPARLAKVISGRGGSDPGARDSELRFFSQEELIQLLLVDSLDILGQQIDAGANLFDYGGTSISLLTLLDRLRTRTGIEVSVLDAIQQPTIERIVQLAEEHQRAASSGSDR